VVSEGGRDAHDYEWVKGYDRPSPSEAAE